MNDTQPNATAPATNGLTARAARGRALNAAFDTGDIDTINAALARHPNGEGGLDRLLDAIVGGGQKLSRDTIRMERLDDERDGQFWDNDHDGLG